MDIAEIGRNHLRDTLTAEKSHCKVTEWVDDQGEPIKIYWLPLTGREQKIIESYGTNVEQTAAALQIRARDESGKAIYANTPVASLINDYDFDVIRTIVFLMTTGMGQDVGKNQEQLEKE
jgi:hypothetical protein